MHAQMIGMISSGVRRTTIVITASAPRFRELVQKTIANRTVSFSLAATSSAGGGAVLRTKLGRVVGSAIMGSSGSVLPRSLIWNSRREKSTSGDEPEQPPLTMEKKEELMAKLTPLQYHVTQEAGTERPFTGKYNKFYEKGTYICVVCSQELFSSETKYDSGCGWPAFNDVLDAGKVTLHKDPSIPGGNILLLITQPGRVRTEVRCSKCAAHMGHVFEDGPPPTRKRYCINSASIEFMAAGSERKDGSS